MTRSLHVDPVRPIPEPLQEAASVLEQGGLVVLPTDTVYGVAADAFNEAAVEKLYKAKGRPKGKPIPVFISSRTQLPSVARHVPRLAEPLMETFWPGPLTLVFDARPEVPLIVTAASGTVGVRVPDNPVVLGVLGAFEKPIACTSANPSGGATPADNEELEGAFLSQIDLVLGAGATRIGIPSTVIDVTTTSPRLIREGAVKAERIEELLKLRLDRR